jgi:secondary thiamine-phosphate synthase enzyme
MHWDQHTFQLKPRARGFHLIDKEIARHLSCIAEYQIGFLNLFIQHTSASLTINENADPTVRIDMETHFNKFVPQGMSYYQHDYEGDDDMPAHIKASILGSSVTIPIKDGRLALGTWQGIYLGEHRDYGGARTLIATLNGQKSKPA